MRVLLVDDQTLFLEGLENLLAARGIEVAGMAGDGLEALERARALDPDVILMDVRMPRCNGLEAARAIKAELPDVKIVMLTVSADDGDLFEAIRSGASGYLLKNLDAEEFFRLLSGLAAGETPLAGGQAPGISNEFARTAVPCALAVQDETEEAEPLTPRQVEVLTRVAQGLTYKEIGAELCMTERAIKYHMGQILERLHLQNRVQAVSYAPRAGPIGDRARGSPMAP